jgi:Domain of unknown function (DUF5666)
MGSGRVTNSVRILCGLALASVAIAPAWPAFAQAQSAATAQTSKVLGSITAIDGKVLTIKSDAGVATTVNVSDTTRVVRAEPGAKSLADATPIQFSDLAMGDRVFVTASPGTEGAPVTAIRIVAMKQGDIAQKQQAEQADWQRRGVGGLVKAIDPAAGTVTIASGSRTIVIHTTPRTIFRQYDPESIKFSDAKPSSLDQIHPGDQLRARGDRTPDGADVTAEEIVAGSFRNIAGTVNSVDAAANTVTVIDLVTKKPVVIHVTADSQMHKLPEMMAQGLAARLKNPNSTPGAGAGGGAGAGTGGGAGAGPGGAAGAGPGAASVSSAGQPQAGGSGWRQGAGSGGGPGGQRSGDLSQMLQRTPVVQLSDLHKGDAVMIVATKGTPAAATAVTLLAGVEPLLTVSAAASQSMFSASWNLGGGGAADAAGTP